MKATQALMASESKKPLVDNKKYNSIMESVKRAIDRGDDHVSLGFTLPNEKTMDRLKAEGYRFYSLGDWFLMPKMYGISWAEEPAKKKKWWQL